MTGASRRRLVVDLAAIAQSWALPERGADRIRESAPPEWEVAIMHSPTDSSGDGGRPASPEVLEAVVDAEAYFGFGMPRDLFLAARRLRWIHSASAGVGSLLYKELLESPVVITNSAGVMGDPIAEQAIAGILYFVRNLDIAVAQQRRSEWNKAPFTGDVEHARELSECRVVVVGTGGIGSAVARRLSAMGCRCVGVRRRVEEGAPPGFHRVASFEHLDAELPEADILVLATPLTPLTRGLLGAGRIDCLPPGAIVVNVARGALVDEEALAARLAGGRLRGAVLDVFQKEPLPASSPLWGMPNVLITPHVSAVSPRMFWERELDLFLDNWSRYRAGSPLRNQVDKDAGY